MGFVRWLIAPIALAIAILLATRSFQEKEKVQIATDGWFGSGPKRPDNTAIVPFTLRVPDDVIEDLKSRLLNTRLSHEVLEDSDNFEYGFNAKYLREIESYWLNKYDWRAAEAKINAFPQFTTEIEGIQVHYYHVKPDAKKYKKTIPLLILHGWPGNVFEFNKILPMLSDPLASKVGGADFAFEVIAPSIPGFGFTGAPRKKGFTTIAMARVFKKLMDRVGHSKFLIQGGDVGSAIAACFGRMYPESLYGVHFNMFQSAPLTSLKGTLLTIFGSFFPKSFFAHEHHHSFNYFSNFAALIAESGYMHIQATKPDTIGTSLNDSPIGLAAYILEKFSTWTNIDNKKLPDGGLTKKFTMDELLTVVMIYWTQGNIVSSMRSYKEFFSDPAIFELSAEYMSVPTAHAQFKNEFFDKEPPEILANHANLTLHSVMPDGGHFAAMEEPALLAKHVFQFMRSLI